MVSIKRVLIIGLGSIGKRHLENLKELYPNVEIIILRRKEHLSSYDGCIVVHELEEAIAFEPQAALICTPSTYHLNVAHQLLDNGVHVFIEKPISNNSDGILELKQKALANNIKVMVGYNLRFVESLIFFRALLQMGRYGATFCVKAEVGQYLPDWRPGMDYINSASALKSLGGGALLELSHELDYLSWIFGQPTYVIGQSLKVSNLEIDVDDLVMAQVGYENNDICTNASIHLDFLQRRAFRQCKAICEKGTIIWDAIADNVILFTDKEEEVLFQGDMNRNISYLSEIKVFIDAIENDSDIPICIDDALTVMSLVDAIRSSTSPRHFFNEK